MKKVLLCLCFIYIFCLCNLEVYAQSLLGEKDKYVIVIDPGHGGENKGTIANPSFEEKDILMQTALALVKELEKYEQIEVHLSRTEDVDISLRDRAVFAKNIKADFLFSLHYNASENHSMFGTEVWIPLKAPYHSQCYKFAYLQQLEMQDLGLFSRGIKTRKNDDGKDYYGIIRECVAREIPAVIIEHCYVDEDRDADYVDEMSDYEEFGRRDAIAIAKFLGVYEDMSGVDESLYKIKKNETIAHTYEDFSGPNQCRIDTEHTDYENGVLTIKVNAVDNQTPVMYYSYSLDGGKTFSKLYAWPDTDMIACTYSPEFSLMINVPDGCVPEIVVRAYNKFDIYRTSNKLKGFEAFLSPTAPPAVISPKKPVIQEHKSESAIYVIADILNKEPEEVRVSLKRILVLVIFLIIWMSILLFMFHTIHYIIKKRGKSQNNKNIKNNMRHRIK